jgi:hypothetical protein
MGPRITLVVTLAMVGFAAPATPASALGLSLTAGAGATLAPFKPGATATGSGTLTITTLLSPWTLTVQDATGTGRMVKAATGCAGSDAQLANALTVAVTGPGGVTSTGRQTIGSTAVQVAGGGGLLNLASLTTSYSQVIPAAQVLRTGCAYSLTVTYTLQ